MAVYKNIRGTHITTVAADPPAPVNGQCGTTLRHKL